MGTLPKNAANLSESMVAEVTMSFKSDLLATTLKKERAEMEAQNAIKIKSYQISEKERKTHHSFHFCFVE